MNKEQYTPNLISIIIPAYNCRDTICRAIDSCIAQDADWELLVIDDASPESIDDVLEKYRSDRRIHYYRNSKNRGVSYTRNRGIKLAKGEYLAFLDADDYWRPDKLRKQQKLLEQKGEVLCCTGRELVDDSGVSLGRIVGVPETITYRSLMSGNPINNSSVLIRHDVMPFFPLRSRDIHEDFAVWLEVLEEYGSACGINEPLLVYRWDAHSKSGNKLKSAIMTYNTYRFAGFGVPKTILCFIKYAINGLKKYYLR